MPQDPASFLPIGFLRSLVKEPAEPPMAGAVCYRADDSGDGLLYTFPAGTLAGYNFLTADFLLDGEHLIEVGELGADRGRRRVVVAGLGFALGIGIGRCGPPLTLTAAAAGGIESDTAGPLERPQHLPDRALMLAEGKPQGGDVTA